jgi:serine/threonine protein kinase
VRIHIEYRLTLLGSGSFGVVMKARLYNGTLVAVKKIKGQFTEKQMAGFLKEAEVTRNITPHPNVIKCIGLCLAPLCLGMSCRKYL